MKLCHLSDAERASLICSRILGVAQLFASKGSEEVSPQDIRDLRNKLNRIIDLIEESDRAEGLQLME